MNPYYKRVLYIDLSKREYEFKIQEDLNPYIGGVGIGYGLYNDNIDLNPVILAAGPLNGYFPYVSKCALIYEEDKKIREKFGGGNIGSYLNMSETDAIVLYGETKTSLVVEVFDDEVNINEDSTAESYQFSKVYDLQIYEKGVLSLDIFSFGETEKVMNKLGSSVKINVNATESIDFKDYYEYEKLYKDALENYSKLSIEPANNPSCFGCPIGCENSFLSEESLNIAVLPRCLVSCGYAEQIYKEIPFVYACLSSVGYLYQHEDLEKVPDLVGSTKKEINEILNR